MRRLIFTILFLALTLHVVSVIAYAVDPDQIDQMREFQAKTWGPPCDGNDGSCNGMARGYTKHGALKLLNQDITDLQTRKQCVEKADTNQEATECMNRGFQ